MTLTRKDVVATVFTGLVVLVFAAAYQSWDVWLVGSSNRWAAGVMLVLGLGACSQSSPAAMTADGEKPSGVVLALSIVGAAALAFGVWALATGSMTGLSLLLAATLVLWAGSTLLHAWHSLHAPVAA